MTHLTISFSSTEKTPNEERVNDKKSHYFAWYWRSNKKNPLKSPFWGISTK
jgi:hypothetical protein